MPQLWFIHLDPGFNHSPTQQNCNLSSTAKKKPSLFRLSSLYRQTAETEKERAADLLEAADYCEQVLLPKHKTDYSHPFFLVGGFEDDFISKPLYKDSMIGLNYLFSPSPMCSLPRSWSSLPHTRSTTLPKDNSCWKW